MARDSCYYCHLQNVQKYTNMVNACGDSIKIFTTVRSPSVFVVDTTVFD